MLPSHRAGRHSDLPAVSYLRLMAEAVVPDQSAIVDPLTLIRPIVYLPARNVVLSATNRRESLGPAHQLGLNACLRPRSNLQIEHVTFHRISSFSDHPAIELRKCS
jgi:hypothetical protein